MTVMDIPVVAIMILSLDSIGRLAGEPCSRSSHLFPGIFRVRIYRGDHRKAEVKAMEGANTAVQAGPGQLSVRNGKI